MTRREPRQLASGIEHRAAIIAYLTERADAGDEPPSFRQIGEHLGITSTATVVWHLRLLRRAGRVDWPRYGRRAIRVTRPA